MQASDIVVVDASSQGAVVGQFTHNFHKGDVQIGHVKLVTQVSDILVSLSHVIYNNKKSGACSRMEGDQP